MYGHEGYSNLCVCVCVLSSLAPYQVYTISSEAMILAVKQSLLVETSKDQVLTQQNYLGYGCIPRATI